MHKQTTGFTPEINLDKCTRCGACVTACPEGVLAMRELGPAIVRADLCTYCASCEDACPESAVRCELEFVWDDSNQ